MLAFGLVPSETPLAFAQFMPFSALTGLEELLRAAEARAACQDPAPWPGDEVLEEEGRGA